MKRVDSDGVTNTSGTIDAEQILENCHGLVFGAYIHGLNGISPDINLAVTDADGRDVLNGLGQGLAANRIITFDQLGGGGAQPAIAHWAPIRCSACLP
ncbi:MAG: hypothetical protein ACR2GY_03335 [Phycisphaerales bacterium]